MTRWVPPEQFAKVVADRIGGKFKRPLKAMTNAELIDAFHANVVAAKQEIAKLRREIADCMPGDFKLNGDKNTPGLLYRLTKATAEGRHWEEYLAWAREGQEQAEPVKREPIASAVAHDPRLPREHDDEDDPLPF